LSVLALAFSRAAFNTRFEMENSAFNMNHALADTQKAIDTGKLLDRETGRVIETAPGGIRKLNNDKWLQKLISVKALLQDARETYTAALKEKKIIDHGNYVTLYDGSVGSKIDRLRKEAVQILNEVLQEADLSPVVT